MGKKSGKNKARKLIAKRQEKEQKKKKFGGKQK